MESFVWEIVKVHQQINCCQSFDSKNLFKLNFWRNLFINTASLFWVYCILLHIGSTPLRSTNTVLQHFWHLINAHLFLYHATCFKKYKIIKKMSIYRNSHTSLQLNWTCKKVIISLTFRPFQDLSRRQTLKTPLDLQLVLCWYLLCSTSS